MTKRQESGEELVPLWTDFDRAWRGYDQRQVRQYVRQVEAELKLLTTDRDAAATEAEEMARQLTDLRAENAELRQRLDRVCRTPIEPDALADRLQRMIELANDEAREITERAKETAEQTWAEAQRAGTRLQLSYRWLLAELDKRREQMETEHRELLDRTQARIEETNRHSAERRRQLEEHAAQHRKQVQEDFDLAMTTRRNEAIREITERKAAARAEADRLVRDARERADRMLTDARRQVDELRALRETIAGQLRTARQVIAEVDAIPQPVPEQRNASAAPAAEGQPAG